MIMNLPLSQCAVLWLGCMAGYSSSLRESMSRHDYQQGQRRLHSDHITDSNAGWGRGGGAPWPGAQAENVGPTRTSQRTAGDNETQAFLGVLGAGMPYGQNEEENMPEETTATHHNRKRSLKSSSSTKSSKGSKKGSKSSKKGSKSSKKGSKSSKKGSKSSKKASDSSKGSKSSKSKGSQGKGPSFSATVETAPTSSPTKVTKGSSHTENSSDGEDDKDNSSTPKPSRGTNPVADLDRASDFPSQAPTCLECDDIQTLAALNKLASAQDQQLTRRNVAKLVVAIVVGVSTLVWLALVLIRLWRRSAVHSGIEAIYDDNPAHDSKFSDSDVTVVMFEDDDDDDDGGEALEA